MISPGFFTYFAIVSCSLVLDGRSRISQVFNTCTWVSEYSGFRVCIFHEISMELGHSKSWQFGSIEYILVLSQWISWSLEWPWSDCALFLLFSSASPNFHCIMIFSEILIKIRNHSSRMRTDHTVTRPSSEPVFMRSIVDRQTPVKTLPSLAVGNQGPQPNLLHRITPHFGKILVPPPVYSHFQVYKHVWRWHWVENCLWAQSLLQSKARHWLWHLIIEQRQHKPPDGKHCRPNTRIQDY